MALPRSLPSPIRIKGTRHKARLNLYLPRQGVGRRRGAKIECQALPHQGMSTSIAPPPKSAKLAGTRGRVSKWGRRSALLCLGSALPPRAGGASASPLAQRGVPSLPSPSAAHRPNLETHPHPGAFQDGGELSKMRLHPSQTSSFCPSRNALGQFRASRWFLGRVSWPETAGC